MLQRVASTVQGSLGGFLPAQVAHGGLAAARHLWFVATRLAIGACGLAALPFCLAVHGHVTPVITLVLIGFTAQAAFALLTGGVGLAWLHRLSVVTLCLCVSLAYAIAPDWAWPLSGLCLALMIEAIMLAGAAGLALTTVCAAAVFGVLFGLQAVSGAEASNAPRLAFLFASGSGLIAATFAGCRFALSALQDLESRESSLKRHARALPDTLDDLVLKLDGMGAAIAASRSGGALAGIPVSGLLGRALFDRVHVADKPLFLKTISDALHSRETCVARLRLRADQPWPSPPGQDAAETSPGDAGGAMGYAGHVWLDIRARAVPAEANEPSTEILCVMRDVTAEVSQGEALDALRREAGEAIRSRACFAATVSHELRTPLGAVMGFAEILASERLAPSDEAKRRDYAQVIQGQARHLLLIVDTLLDLAKIETGGYEIQREDCRVDQVVAAAIDMVKHRADKGAVAMSVEIEQALPDLRADRRAMLQILVNLLGNAVKFTPPGGKVTLSARREDGTLEIAVTDSGIGIAPEHLSRLGEPFFRAGRGAGEADGAGLGLAVVRGLLDLHGGLLTLDSRVGQGSRATVRLAFDARHRLAPTRFALPAGRHKTARSIVSPDIAVKKIA